MLDALYYAQRAVFWRLAQGLPLFYPLPSVKSGKGAEAADRAGYKGNRRTLAQIGSENLEKPYIKKKLDEIYSTWGMGAREVIAGETKEETDYLQVEESAGLFIRGRQTQLAGRHNGESEEIADRQKNGTGNGEGIRQGLIRLVKVRSK